MSLLFLSFFLNQEEPYLYLIEDDEEKKYEGFCADLAKKIADTVPFDYIIKPVKDEKYGQMNETDKTWNGMVGELVHHVSDKYTLCHTQQKSLLFPLHCYVIIIIIIIIINNVLI